jgi:hypothetical protein
MEFRKHNTRLREFRIKVYRYGKGPKQVDLSINCISTRPGRSAVLGEGVIDHPLDIGIIYPYGPTSWIRSSSQRVYCAILSVASDGTTVPALCGGDAASTSILDTVVS